MSSCWSRSLYQTLHAVQLMHPQPSTGFVQDWKAIQTTKILPGLPANSLHLGVKRRILLTRIVYHHLWLIAPHIMLGRACSGARAILRWLRVGPQVLAHRRVGRRLKYTWPQLDPGWSGNWLVRILNPEWQAHQVQVVLTHSELMFCEK